MLSHAAGCKQEAPLLRLENVGVLLFEISRSDFGRMRLHPAQKLLGRPVILVGTHAVVVAGPRAPAVCPGAALCMVSVQDPRGAHRCTRQHSLVPVGSAGSRPPAAAQLAAAP